MNRSWPVHLNVVLCVFCILLSAIVWQAPLARASELSPNDNHDSSYTGPSIPNAIQDLIRNADAKYLEGSNLIKSGDSDKARESFNKAVDILLQSDWDIPSTPSLHQHFQELIQKIQDDESRYLLAGPCDEDEESPENVENAVVDELDQLDLHPISIDPSLQDALEHDIAGTKYEIPITINEMVAKFLDYWLKGGRKYFVDGLVRSGQYRPMIEKVFREESIPLDLMYLAQVESLFKTHAVSKAKAKGIWQFEKDTAIRYGLKVTRDVDERSDPEKSTRAAARYLNDLFSMFKDWNLALAAYNWGEGKVLRLVNSTGLNDFWQLIDLKSRVPTETKNHVPLIQASVILGRNPEKFGLPTELAPPLKYAEVSVSKPIDLRAAAKVLSTSIDELKKLNPSLRGFTTPSNYPNFQLKVPANADPDSHEKLASLPTAKVTLPPLYDCRHKVAKGETLQKIAAKYRISVSALARANGISSKMHVKVGTWLQVPSRPDIETKAAASKRGKTSVSSARAASGKSTNSKKVASRKKGRTGKGGEVAVNAKTKSKSRTASLKHQLDSKAKQLASN